MPLTKEKRKLNKLIQESDSDESEHELAYYVNDRIKLMKEVLKIVKPKKIKAMAPACLKNLEIEEINSMLLEELLGISNKRLKYIFNGQDLEEDSSTTSEDEPMDVISLDDISDEELVINIDDDKEEHEKRLKKRVKHNKSKKERKHSLKKEDLVETSAPKEIDLDSKKNLMSVLELLELQARARAIKSQLLLENAKVQESVALSKIPTLEEKVGSDDEIIIKTTKTEEIVITSSDDEEISRVKKLDNKLVEEKDIKSTENSTASNDNTVLNNVEENNSEPTQNSDKLVINIIENTELSTGKVPYDKDVSQNDTGDKKIIGDTNISKNMQVLDNSKSCDNDGIIQINLSDDEIDSMK